LVPYLSNEKERGEETKVSQSEDLELNQINEYSPVHVESKTRLFEDPLALGDLRSNL